MGAFYNGYFIGLGVGIFITAVACYGVAYLYHKWGG